MVILLQIIFCVIDQIFHTISFYHFTIFPYFLISILYNLCNIRCLHCQNQLIKRISLIFLFLFAISNPPICLWCLWMGFLSWQLFQGFPFPISFWWVSLWESTSLQPVCCSSFATRVTKCHLAFLPQLALSSSPHLSPLSFPLIFSGSRIDHPTWTVSL